MSRLPKITGTSTSRLVCGLAAAMLAGELIACTPSGSGGGDAVSSKPAERAGAAEAGAEAAGDGEGDGEAVEPEAATEGADAGVEPEPDADEGPQAPPDYGLMKPVIPAPDPQELKIHALVGYEVVAVYAEPKMEAEKLGFLRYGQRMKVTERKGTEGCPKGWYGLPEGGFACASKGLVVDRNKSPYMHADPPPPNLDGPTPYEWSYVRNWNSPMWWRTPTKTELARAAKTRAVREAERTGEPLPGSEPKATPTPTPTPEAADTDAAPATPPAAGDEDGPDLAALPKPDGVDDGADAATPEDPAPTPEDDPEPAAGADGDGGATPAGTTAADPVADEPPAEPPPPLPLNPQHPWLEKGFFISLAGKVTDDGHSYWQTARGGFVAQADAWKYEPKDFQGAEITEQMSFPVGFVMNNKGTTVYELTEDGKLSRVKHLDKRDFVDLAEETEVGGKTYMTTQEGHLIRKDHLRLPTLQALPEGLEPYDRWIDVTLADQLLVAYEGTRPVYTTLVSTGRKGSAEEPFETPTGRWRIYSKQVTSNMDGATATDGNYAIQDVPWVMYFDGSYALHGAFWHRSFGHVRSHGCVNLGPSDARWLFFWTTPFLPTGWHGVHATKDSPGTTVVVRP